MLQRLFDSLRPGVAPNFAESAELGRTIFSFIVDADPKFAYQGYHLARSLIQHSCNDPADIHIQFAREVPGTIREIFSKLRCSAHELERFGDGRYCNKIAQLANLKTYEFKQVVLLDTDTIALADLRPHLSADALLAKVADLANPSVTVLREIARRAGMRRLPPLISTDAGKGQTYLGNCNGGFYAIPKKLCLPVDTEWRRWASWLLGNVEPLKREGKETHVDQVAMWLAIHMADIPYQPAPSNLNYYVHFAGEHRNLDSRFNIALIHYHDCCLNALGQIEPHAKLQHAERHAIEGANKLIRQGFESGLKLT
jgi:hypothetical protein